MEECIAGLLGELKSTMEEVGTRRMIAVRLQRNLEHAEGNEP